MAYCFGNCFVVEICMTSLIGFNSVDSHEREILASVCRDLVPVRRFRLAAAVIQPKSGKILSLGFAHKKTHPFQYKFKSHDFHSFWHAETHAIYNALKAGIDLSGMDLCVMRVGNASGMPLMLAKPCVSGCMQCIEHYGIRNVYFSTGT